MRFCGLSKINSAVTHRCRGRQGSIQRLPRYYRKVCGDDENLTTLKVIQVITYHY
jgi:hypothetical protein